MADWGGPFSLSEPQHTPEITPETPEWKEFLHMLVEGLEYVPGVWHVGVFLEYTLIYP